MLNSKQPVNIPRPQPQIGDEEYLSFTYADAPFAGLHAGVGLQNYALDAEATTLVLGVGNILLGDEGIGIRVIEQLQQLYCLPPAVRVVDGGTLGMDLLYFLEGIRNLLIIDAVETGEAPGSSIRLTGEEVPAYFAVKMSPHQVGVPDMLFAAKLRDLYPEEIVLLGVQPGVLEPVVQLSAPVAAQVAPLVEQVAVELERWGITAQRR